MTDLTAVPDPVDDAQDQPLPIREIPAYEGDAKLWTAAKAGERIIADLGAKTVPISGLEHWPGNARRGDTEFIADSLARHGQFRPILVQKSTGRVILGNHTLRACRDVLGWVKIAADTVDMGDEQARRINIADNHAQDLSGWDNEALLKELDLIRAEGDGTLTGTFDQLALDGLLKEFGRSGPDSSGEIAAPDSFGVVDPDQVKTDYRCPRCSYEWSGNQQ